MRALNALGIKILSIADVTPVPHNGCRPPQASSHFNRTENTKWLVILVQNASRPVARAPTFPEERPSSAWIRNAKLESRPGQHGAKQNRVSSTASQLRKSRRSAASTVCSSASSAPICRSRAPQGATGENLLQLLESRLDNSMYRMGFGSTRAEGRQLVSHGAVLVNGKPVNIPSTS